MTTPKLLDLFCGAGGAGEGYHRAGFEVTGVDIKPQPRYKAGTFIQADALDYVAAHGWEYDAIHASPPCQAYSGASKLAGVHQKEYLDYIPQTRFWLEALGLPYVIENVAGARLSLRNPIMMCGAQFGLKVYRHRLFESNVLLFALEHQPHRDQCPPAGRGKSPKGFFTVCSGGISGVTGDERRTAMGVDWYMTNYELAQAIPPAYTEYIGQQLMRAVLFNRERNCA